MATILVVEDDHKLRPFMLETLDEAGHNAVPAGTVSEAMMLVSQYRFDLAIVDLKLPNGDGMEIISEIHEDIQTVILTGYPSHEARSEASCYGVYAFIEKPFNESLLIAAVEGALNGDIEPPPYRIQQSHSREIGDPVDEQLIYTRLTAIGEQVKRLAKGHNRIKDHVDKQNGTLHKLTLSVETVMERTRNCAERGKAIAILEERARVQGINWNRVISLVLALVQAGAAIFIVRLANEILSQIP